MKYLLLIFAPIFLFLDILLKNYSFKLYKNALVNNIEYEFMEKGSFNQGTTKINKNKFVKKTIILLIIYSLILYFSYNDNVLQFFLGFVLIFHLEVLFMHFQNILTFKFFKKNPETLKGKLSVSHQYSINNSKNQILHMLLISSIFLVFSPSFFIFGGCLSLLYQYLFWN